MYQNITYASPDFRRRTRASILLFGAFAAAILLISGYTIRLLVQQRSLSREEVREFRTHALAGLANRLEHELSRTIQQPISELSGKPPGNVDGAGFKELQKLTPELTGLLVLDNNLNIRAHFPRSSATEEAIAEDWILRKIKFSGRSGLPTPSLIDKIAGRFTLFVVAPMKASDVPVGWRIFRFDLDALLERVAKPLFAEFSAKLRGEVELIDPETWDRDNDESGDYVAWPAGHVLPAWMLSFTPTPQQSSLFNISVESASIVGVMSGVVMVLIMAAFSIWRELRREQVVAELRSRFVANVTHELKTPLALIRMYAETLHLRRIQEPDRQHEYHHIILREAERLSDMITKVLDFSSANQGARIYHLTETDLKETVEEFLAVYASKVEEAGLRLRVSLASDLPPVAHDRHGVTQILINLVDNGIKYGAAGGVMSVRLRRWGKEVRLAVTDFGPGIPGEEMERVLRPFERGSQTDPTTGTGLGLALVDQIVKAHHARLTMSPAVGRQGLSVSILFPIQKSV